MTRVPVIRNRILKSAETHCQSWHSVQAITGKGLMIGLVMPDVCAELVSVALENKLLINVTAGNVIRLLPALTLTDDEADMIGARLAKAIDQYSTQRAQV